MKNLTKFALFAALCGAFVGCGGDSGSNSSGSDESNANSQQVTESSSSEAVLSSSQNDQSGSSVDPESPQGDVSSNSEESSSIFSGIDPSTVIKGTMTDERDGKVYKTVTIGEQTWMAENLNYAYNVPTTEWDSSSFCFINSADSCSKYGRLYLWSAAMDSAAVFSTDGKDCGRGVTCSAGETVRGVCPEGWHLPSRTEWSTLFTAVGGDSIAGTMLKSTSGWYDDGNGKDSYGFSVVPAGERYYDGYFYDAGDYAAFWSSTEYSSNLAYKRYFFWYYATVEEGNSNEVNAYSVRCVKN